MPIPRALHPTTPPAGLQASHRPWRNLNQPQRQSRAGTDSHGQDALPPDTASLRWDKRSHRGQGSRHRTDGGIQEGFAFLRGTPALTLGPGTWAGAAGHHSVKGKQKPQGNTHQPLPPQAPKRTPGTQPKASALTQGDLKGQHTEVGQPLPLQLTTPHVWFLGRASPTPGHCSWGHLKIDVDTPWTWSAKMSTSTKDHTYGKVWGSPRTRTC